MPMLAEFQDTEPPKYNPAFLGFGYDALNLDTFRGFHLRILDMTISYQLIANVFVTNPPSFEDALNSRIGELVQGLSVSFTNPSSRSQIYRDLALAYISHLTGIPAPPTPYTPVVPPLAAAARAAGGFTATEIERRLEYINYRNRVEGDATTLLNNIGRIIGEIGLDYLKEQPLFDSQIYVRLFDLEFLLGAQVALGFGINSRSFINVKEDTTGFTVDVTRLNLPRMNLNEVNLATLPGPIPNWVAASRVDTLLGLALGLATTNYLRDLTNALDQNRLGSLVLRSLFEQSYIKLYQVIEPNVRFSFGVSLTPWLYWGNRFQAQLLWGVDNLMLDPDVLDLSEPIKLAGFLYNPLNYQVSIHAGWDTALLIQPVEWWNLSIMFTDVLGLAPSITNASQVYWGDFYYPIDLQLGTFFQFRIGSEIRLGFGGDIYQFISMIAAREQRFSHTSSVQFIDYLRAKFYFEYISQFRLSVHYWNQGIGFAFEFDFLSFHPGIGVEIDFDLKDVRIRLDILHLTN